MCIRCGTDDDGPCNGAFVQVYSAVPGLLFHVIYNRIAGQLQFIGFFQNRHGFVAIAVRNMVAVVFQVSREGAADVGIRRFSVGDLIGIKNILIAVKFNDSHGLA